MQLVNILGINQRKLAGVFVFAITDVNKDSIVVASSQIPQVTDLLFNHIDYAGLSIINTVPQDIWITLAVVFMYQG